MVLVQVMRVFGVAKKMFVMNRNNMGCLKCQRKQQQHNAHKGKETPVFYFTVLHSRKDKR